MEVEGGLVAAHTPGHLQVEAGLRMAQRVGPGQGENRIVGSASVITSWDQLLSERGDGVPQGGPGSRAHMCRGRLWAQGERWALSVKRSLLGDRELV
jgi:hypothetical protein